MPSRPSKPLRYWLKCQRLECGRAFRAKSPLTKWCSRSCKNRAHYVPVHKVDTPRTEDADKVAQETLVKLSMGALAAERMATLREVCEQRGAQANQPAVIAQERENRVLAHIVTPHKREDFYIVINGKPHRTPLTFAQAALAWRKITGVKLPT